MTKFVTRFFEVMSDEDTDKIDDWFDEMAQEFSNIEIVGYTSTMTGLIITCEVEDNEMEEAGMPR